MSEATSSPGPNPFWVTVGIAMMMAGLILWGWSLLLLFLQAVFWLKHDFWFPVPAEAVFTDYSSMVDKPGPLMLVPNLGNDPSQILLTVGWKGLARIIQGVLDQSLALMVFVLALALNVIGMLISKEVPV